MSEEIINIRVNASASGLNETRDALKSLKGHLKDIKKFAGQASNAISDLVVSTKSLAGATVVATQKTESQKDAIVDLSKVTSVASKTTTEQKKAVESVAVSMTKAEKAALKYAKSQKQLGIDTAGMSDAQKARALKQHDRETGQESGSWALRRTSIKSMEDFRQTLGGTIKAMYSLRTATVQTGRDIEKAFIQGVPVAMGQTVKGIQRITLALGIMRHTADLAFTHMIERAKQMQWIGRQMIVGISLPLALFGQRAVGTFNTVHKEYLKLSKVAEREFRGQSLLGEDGTLGGPGFDALKGEVRDLALEFGMVEDITTALYKDLIALGLPDQDIGKWAEAISELSAVGEIDIGPAQEFARVLSAQYLGGKFEGINEVTKQFDDLSSMLSRMNAIGDETALQIDELAEAFPNVGPVAAQAGFTAEDTASMLASMAQAGIPATEAANALKISMSRLTNPTKAAQKAMDALGFSLFTSTGAADNSIDRIVDLATTLDSLNAEDKAKAMDYLFEGRQSARMGAMMKDISDGWRVFEQGIADGELTLKEYEGITSDFIRGEISSGMLALDQLAPELRKKLGLVLSPDGALMAKNYEEAIEMFKNDPTTQFAAMKSQFKMIMTDIGALVLPMVLELGEKFLGLLDKIMKLPTGVKKFIVSILGLAAAMGPATYIIAQFGLSFGTAGKMILKLLPFIRLVSNDQAKNYKHVIRLGNANIALGKKLEPVIQQTKRLKREMRELGNEAVLASAKTKVAFNSMGAKDQGALMAMAGASGTSIPGIAEELTPDSGKKSGRRFFGGILDGFKSRKADGLGFFKNFGKTASGALAGGFTGLSGMLGSVASALGPILIVAIAIIPVFIAIALAVKKIVSMGGVLKEKLTTAWEAIKHAAKRVGEAFTKVFNRIMGVFAMFGDQGAEGAASAEDAWSGVADFIAWIADQIATLIEWTANAIEFLLPVFEAVARGIFVVVDLIRSFTTGSFEEIAKAVGRFLWELLRPFAIVLQKVLGWIAQGIFNLIDKILGAITGVVRAIADSPLGGIADFVTPGDLSAVTDEWDSWGDSLRNLGEEAFNFMEIVPVIDDFLERPEIQFEDFFSLQDVLDGLKDLVPGSEGDDVLDDWNDFGEDLGNELSDGAEEAAKEKIADWLPDWLGAVKSQLDSLMDQVKEAAKKAFDDYVEKVLGKFDAQIEAIEAVEKAEQRLFATQEYLEKKRQMLRDRALAKENYEKNRALAIYEGRIDDARQLDRDFEAQTNDFNDDMASLEKDRARELVSQQREDAKESIQIAKEAEQERLDIVKENLDKMLDAITKYTPRNVAEWNSMIGQITNVLQVAGVDVWPGMFMNGLMAFGTAIRNANEQIVQDAAWSGLNAATGWLAGFISNEALQILLKSHMDSVGASAADSMTSAGYDAGSGFAAGMDSGLDSVEDGMDEAEDGATTLGGWITNQLTTASNNVSSTVNKNNTWLSSAIEYAKRVSAGHVRDTNSAVGNAVNNAGTKYVQMSGWLGNSIATANNAIKGMMNVTEGSVSESITRMHGWFSSIAPSMQNVIQTAKDVAQALISAAFGPKPAQSHDGGFVSEARGLNIGGGKMLSITAPGEGIVPRHVMDKMGTGGFNRLKTGAALRPYAGVSGAPQVGPGAATTVINVDTFIGQRKWFDQMMRDYDMMEGRARQRESGSQSRTIKGYNK